MNLKFKTLNKENEHHYEKFINGLSHAMFYHSLLFRDFLKKILSNSTDIYLLVYENNELIAIVPNFIKHGPLGSVMNSLPFFGSHGGLISKKTLSKTVLKEIFLKLDSIAIQNNVIASNIIETLFSSNSDNYIYYNSDFKDHRIGQVTMLPKVIDINNYQSTLFSLFHGKTRNAIRKGNKSGYFVTHNGSSETFKKLFELHEANMKSINAIPKPWFIFETIKEVFKYERDYRIYIAKYNNEIISALMIFFYKNTIEYFCPATHVDHRINQPMSMLINKAMIDSAIDKNSLFWNWGGTWLSQKEVYKFKSRWGAKDLHYKFHIKIFKDINVFKAYTKTELLKNYEFFYTIPFEKI